MFSVAPIHRPLVFVEALDSADLEQCVTVGLHALLSLLLCICCVGPMQPLCVLFDTDCMRLLR